MKIAIILSVFFCIADYCRGDTVVLTEKDVLVNALKSNYDILVIGIEKQSDSIDVVAAESSTLPEIALHLGSKVYPLDSTERTIHVDTTIQTQNIDSSFTIGSNNQYLVNDFEVTASQSFPGGGVLSGSLKESHNKNFSTDSSNYTTDIELLFTQPLLKNGLKFANPAYAIKIRHLDNSQFSLEQKKRILSSLTSVRLLYWELFEKQMLRTIFLDQMIFARKHLETERIKHKIGNTTVIDTLSAHLDYLQAKGSYLGAQTEVALAQKELIVALALDVDSLSVDTADLIQITQLPPPDTFLTMVESFDPQCAVFSVVSEKLALQELYQKNQLLPSLGVQAGVNYSASGDAPFSKSYSAINGVVGVVLSYSFPVRNKLLDIQQTQLAKKKNTLSQEHYKRKLKKQIQDLYLSWRQELQSLQIAQASKEIALQKFHASKAGYEIGTVDQLTLDKAEDDYVETSIRLLQKQILMKRLEIVFDEITGVVLSKFGVTIE